MRSQASIDRAKATVYLPDGDGPHILLYDIETMAAEGYMWNLWNTNIIRVKHDWYMLSFAYKWLDEDEVRFVALWDDPKFTRRKTYRDDWHVAVRLHALFDHADVIIAHNGDKFDRRKANARFVQHDLTPPSPYRTIDTKKESARYTAQLSNSLANLCEQWGFGGKVEHPGFDMWVGAAAGERRWTDLMEEYNRHDITLLEFVYYKLRGWMGTPGNYRGVNYGFWAKGQTVCAGCGSTNLRKEGTRMGYYRTIVSEFQRFQCRDCGNWGRARKRESQINEDGENIGVQLV